MTSRNELLREIESFMQRHRIGVSRFGLECLNDHKFVPRLRAGKDVRSATVDKVMRYMREYERACSKSRTRQKIALRA